MAKVGSWSTTPGSNNSSPPDGWPEGQAPSTVNDCAREMMASIRTLINDAQFIDQNLTPTFINTTSFSVAGNQTSAIHAGRRLKLFDATAGVATVLYATVVTASFTTVTTVSISADAGQLTSSLSSFAIAILSNTNDSLPRKTAASYSAVTTDNLTINGTTTASGAVSLLTTLSVSGAVALNSTLTVSGAASLLTTLSVSGAAVLKSTLNVEGTTSLSGAVACATTLSVSGATVLRGTLSIGGAIVGGSTATFSGDVLTSVPGGNSVAVALDQSGISQWKLENQATTGNFLIAQGGNIFVTAVVSSGAIGIASTLSVSGATVLKGALSVGGAVNLASTLTVGGAVAAVGAVRMDSTLSVSGTVVAANVAKAWVACLLTPGGVTVDSSFNISSVSRSATGVAKVTFTNAFADSFYCPVVSAIAGGGVFATPTDLSRAAATCKVTARNVNQSAVDSVFFSIAFYR